MREMKDSNLSWIGVIPEDWHIIRIKFCSTLKGRIGWQGLTTAEYTDEGPYLVTGVDFKNGSVDWIHCNHVNVSRWEEDPYIQINNGDLLITKDGTVGKVAVVSELKEKATLNSGVLLIRPTRNVYDARYLYWVLCSDVFKKWFADINAGNSTIIHLYQGDFFNFSFPLPNLEKQRNIVSLLDSKCSEIDALSADIQKEIETLQEYRKSVITEAVTKGLDPDVEMKDSGIEWIGDIPRHWTTIKLKNTHDGMNVGESIDKEYWEESDGDIVFYTAGLNPITTTYRHFPPEKYTRDNDLLLARNGTPYVYLPIENSVYTDHIIRVKIKDGYSKKYIMYCLERSINAEIVDTVSIATWSSSIWNRQCFPLPSYEEQKVIASFLDSKCSEIDCIIADKQKQIETLAEYRKSLIYEYVTGKKEVTTA